MEGDVMGTTSWRDDLPEELRDVSFIRAAESPEHAAAEIKNAAQYMGQSVRLPKEGEDPAQFLEKIQKYLPEQPPAEPASAPEPFEVPEDIDLPEAVIEQARALDMSQAQFDKLAERIQAETATQQEQAQAFRQAQRDALRAKWDTDLDMKLGQVNSMLMNTGAPEQIVKAMEQGSLDAETTQWLAGLANLGDEGAEVTKGAAASPVSEITAIDTQLRSGKLDGLQYQRLLDRKVTLMNSTYGGLKRSAG